MLAFIQPTTVDKEPFFYISRHKNKNGTITKNGWKFQKIWYHQPLTDIWQIGKGIANRLHKYGAYDLHGITMVPEAKLYKEFLNFHRY